MVFQSLSITDCWIFKHSFSRRYESVPLFLNKQARFIYREIQRKILIYGIIYRLGNSACHVLVTYMLLILLYIVHYSISEPDFKCSTFSIQYFSLHQNKLDTPYVFISPVKLAFVIFQFPCNNFKENVTCIAPHNYSDQFSELLRPRCSDLARGVQTIEINAPAV